MTDLYRRLHIYKDLVEIVKANPATLRPADFFNWARDNYVLTMCIGIRRLADADAKVVSLGRLLREVEMRSEVVTRQSYRAVQRRKGVVRQDADETFDDLTGKRVQHLPNGVVSRDIAQIEQVEARIRRFVNKRLAHAAPLSKIRRFPTFQEIEDALEIFDQVLVRYDALLRGGGLSTLHPDLLDWRRVFWNAWIPQGPRASLPRYRGPRHVYLSP